MEFGATKTPPVEKASQTVAAAPQTTAGKQDYAERKEQQKKIRKTERAIEDCERKIAAMEERIKELDSLLCDPKNASDMTLVTEYTDIKRQLDKEVERWEQLSEEAEMIRN